MTRSVVILGFPGVQALVQVTDLQLRQFADNEVVNRLKSVPDVYSVVPFGGYKRQLQVIVDRNKLAVMGRVWSVDAVAKNASTSLYGNIVAVAESPLKEGLLFVGTDDGLVQVFGRTDFDLLRFARAVIAMGSQG